MENRKVQVCQLCHDVPQPPPALLSTSHGNHSLRPDPVTRLHVLACTPGQVHGLRLSLLGAEASLYYILSYWAQKLHKFLSFHAHVTLEEHS